MFGLSTALVLCLSLLPNIAVASKAGIAAGILGIIDEGIRIKTINDAQSATGQNIATYGYDNNQRIVFTPNPYDYDCIISTRQDASDDRRAEYSDQFASGYSGVDIMECEPWNENNSNQWWCQLEMRCCGCRDYGDYCERLGVSNDNRADWCRNTHNGYVSRNEGHYNYFGVLGYV